MVKTVDVILGKEWDILIVLDACRYDVFKELFGKTFKVEKAVTEGTCTIEWFYKTFTVNNVVWKDVIYISGSPYIGRHTVKHDNMEYNPLRHFANVVEVWKYAFTRIGYAYTVNPFHVMKQLFIQNRLHRDKKFIVHFMQPHAPYPMCYPLQKYFTMNMSSPDFKLWEALRNNEVDRELVIRCYKQNLLWVMGFVFTILNLFRGKKIVITSDHAECFGENGVVNHPCYRHDVEPLKTVPLVVIP